jgi:membrane protease YdiL (CAAX protease family)
MIGRQSRALVVLVFRNWTRRAMRPGEAPKRGFPSTFILNLGALAYFVPIVWNAAQVAVGAGPLRVGVSAVGLYGVALFAVANALTLLTPELGKLRPPLRHALMDELPVSPFAVMIVTWLSGAAYFVLSAVLVVGLSPELRTHAGGRAWLAGFTLTLSLSAAAVGMALVSLLRAGVAAHVRRKLAWMPIVALLAAMALLGFAEPLAARLAAVPDPMRWVASALQGAHRLGTVAAIAACGIAGLLVTALCETRGYDRIDAASPGPLRAGAVSSMPRAEELLFRREMGRRALLIGTLVGGFSMFGLGRVAPRGGKAVLTLIIAIGFNVVYLPIMLVQQFASTMVRRDVGARPFLSALPLAPHQTLDGKVAALRRYVYPAAVLSLPLGWYALPVVGAWPVVWHLAAFFVALWILCDAAVSVAFLTNGLGAPSAAAAGASGSFATTLLMFPALTACIARTPVDALISLGMLVAIRREARRAALRCVQWIDDAGDVERETEVWRALLVLATFFATQGLVARLLLLFELDTAWMMAIVYAVASAVLGLLMLRQGKRLPRLRLWPKKPAALGVGLLAGAASAALSLGLVKLLTRLGWSPPGEVELHPRGSGLFAIFVAIVVLAPLAEETFFRGWLQNAIAADLPENRRRRAVLYGALAFAAVHVGSLYVPQLLLGLAAGALYFWSGGLLPGMLAHAVHNGLALLLH